MTSRADARCQSLRKEKSREKQQQQAEKVKMMKTSEFEIVRMCLCRPTSETLGKGGSNSKKRNFAEACIEYINMLGQNRPASFVLKALEECSASMAKRARDLPLHRWRGGAHQGCEDANKSLDPFPVHPFSDR